MRRTSRTSIKPGRVPSCMGAVMGTFVAVFGVVWTIGALSMGAPWFFGLFGLVFIGFAITGVVFHLVNATSEKGISTLEIVHSEDQPDEPPVATNLGDYDYTDQPHASRDEAGFEPPSGGFCPYCGTRLDDAFRFCPHCGKEM